MAFLDHGPGRAGAALLFVAAFLLACGASEEAEPSGPPPVLVVPVELRDLAENIVASGELVARHDAVIAAEIEGRVTEIRFDEGEHVETGQIVLSIDPERRQLDVESAKANLAEARAALREQERDFARMRELHARQAASDARLDETRSLLERARSRVDAAQAGLGVAERALRDAGVVAPFSGLVAERFVSRGEFVSTGKPLFEIVALDPVEVEFHVPEVDSSRIHLGDPVFVRVAPWPEEHFEGRVGVVSPKIDTRTRTLLVKATLPNPDGRLRPGLFARVELGVATRSDVPMVPEEAVLQRAEGPVVFVLRDGDRVERRGVETGAHREGWVEIARGVAADDRVIARGHAELVDGARVSPRNADGRPAATAVGELARDSDP